MADDAEDFVAGSASVALVPSAKGFAEKARVAIGDLDAEVRLVAKTDEAEAKLAEFDRDREIKLIVDADTAPARAKIAALDEESKHVGGGAEGASGGFMGALMPIALGLAPALIPITAALGGIAAALSGPLLATGGGLGLFAVVAAKAATSVDAVHTKIVALQKQAASATTTKTADRYFAEAAKLQATLTKPQHAFLAAQTSMSHALHQLENSAAGLVFPVMAKGMNLVAGILPKLAPLLHSVGSALSSVLGDLGGAAKGRGFTGFVDTMAKLAGPSIKSIAGILGHIGEGLASMATAASGSGGSLLSTIDKMTKGFAHVGQSNGFQSFMGYVAKEGPKVASTLGHVVQAVSHLVKALAPIGGLSLGALDGLAKFIHAVPVSVLTPLIVGLGGMALGMKAVGIASALADGPLMATALTIGTMEIPVIAVVAAAALLVVGVYELATHWHQSWNAMKSAAVSVWDWIKGHWPMLVAVIADPIGIAVLEVVKHWHQITAAAKTVWHDIVAIFKGAGKWLLSAGQHLIDGLWNGIRTRATALYDEVKGVAGHVVGVFKSVWKVLSPSRVMMQIGQYLIDGLTAGIRSRKADVSKAMNEISGLISAVNKRISAATSFGQAFAGNPFTAGLATTTTKNKTSVVNGVLTTTSSTAALSKAQIVAEIKSYDLAQEKQAKTLAKDIAELKRKGAAPALIAQMQAGGAAAMPYIEALAAAPAAQVKAISATTKATNTALNKAGAEATGTKSVKAERRELATIKSIDKSLKGTVSVKVINAAVAKLRNAS